MENYLFLLTNSAFPQYTKIGCSNDMVGEVSKINAESNVPEHYEIFAYYLIPEDTEIETMLSAVSTLLSCKKTRDFYEIEASKAYSVLQAIASLNGTQENLHLGEPPKTTPDSISLPDAEKQKRKPQSEPRTEWLFEQGVIKAGDMVYLNNHPEQKAKVVDGKNVDYNGSIMSFNQFGKKISGYSTICIYDYLMIEGNDRVLSELREEKKKELEEMGKNPVVQDTTEITVPCGALTDFFDRKGWKFFDENFVSFSIGEKEYAFEDCERKWALAYAGIVKDSVLDPHSKIKELIGKTFSKSTRQTKNPDLQVKEEANRNYKWHTWHDVGDGLVIDTSRDNRQKIVKIDWLYNNGYLNTPISFRFKKDL